MTLCTFFHSVYSNFLSHHWCIRLPFLHRWLHLSFFVFLILGGCAFLRWERPAHIETSLENVNIEDSDLKLGWILELLEVFKRIIYGGESYPQIPVELVLDVAGVETY